MMDNKIDLSEIGQGGIIPPVQRSKLRQVRPSQWKHNGFKLYKGQKHRSFWVTHTDLVEWAGGLDVLQDRYEFAEDVEDFLWLTFERQSGYVYPLFNEVMEPNIKRLRKYCRQHFAQKASARHQSPVFPFPLENS
jgi:hypothetical protein